MEIEQVGNVKDNERERKTTAHKYLHQRRLCIIFFIYYIFLIAHVSISLEVRGKREERVLANASWCQWGRHLRANRTRVHSLRIYPSSFLPCIINAAKR